jgi:hypothetical protein
MADWTDYTLANHPGALSPSTSLEKTMGIPVILSPMDVGGGGTTPVVVVYKLRGWDTVAADYVFWLSNQTTPADIDSTSIVRIGKA